MYNVVDDVREDSYQLIADSEKDFTDSVDMAEVNDSDGAAATPSNDGGGCDLVSKPTAAPLSSRASAFSIAALMKDCDTDTSAAAISGGQRHPDHNARHTTAGSLYDIAADEWQRHVSNYSGSGETVNAKTDADYWATFSNSTQRRMYF